jgi:ABC-type multidrug transport system ATPase subunit
MNIECQTVSKRYTFNWIIKDLTTSFSGPGIYGIAGSNGSGKSTLLSLISGYLSPSKGTINYTLHDQLIERENIFTHMSIAAPYIEVIEEYTIGELLKVYGKLKPLESNFDTKDFLQIAYLEKDRKKPIKYFSSGMKQRMQLLLAIKTDVPFLLLDEPSSFLDAKAKEWFYSLLDSYKQKKLIIMASNDEDDLQACEELITM